MDQPDKFMVQVNGIGPVHVTVNGKRHPDYPEFATVIEAVKHVLDKNGDVRVYTHDGPSVLQGLKWFYRIPGDEEYYFRDGSAPHRHYDASFTYQYLLDIDGAVKLDIELAARRFAGTVK